ncbi:FAD-binding oxidoreductase [Rhizobium sp. AG855]|uniref:FAD-binding oxidoreductase n=1 Tax=Rhizobium sp. AG855 TaxID=2183898 RepID=UPI000E70A21E|nr:FAD-binding oxidoreductase [Rhizobium sp. AG855]RKE77380.1 ferredoxin-NADP reductase [Rhizobium sp. AG855]
MQQPASSRFQPFEVIAKTRESETITSFTLAPRNKDHWRPFEAGQFLTIRIPDGADGHVLRNYTVSSSPRESGIYRISVKREAAPSAQLPQGFGSCWLHDEVEPGTVLDIDTPRGAFKLDTESTRPVVLLSGGVGLTPTVSMLHVLAHETDRPVWFIHACDSMAVHALRNEVEELAAARSGITVHFCHRFAGDDDMQAGRCHSTGFLGREVLQKLLPLDDYEFYMCGPPPFMKALFGILTGLGVRKERIAYEFFGPASLLSEPELQTAKPTAPNAGDGTGATATVSNDGMRIVLQKSGRELAWTESCSSLLDCLEANGIEPEFSCRAGICGSCEQGFVSGEVDYFEEPLDEVPPGRVLLCCSKPKSSVVLDL